MKDKIPIVSEHIRPIVSQLKAMLQKHYQSRLQYLILYGSYARGTSTKESDIDIMVVLNEMSSAHNEIDVLTELKTDLMLENNVYISTNPTSLDQFNKANQLYYRNVKNEGIIL